MTKVTGYPTNPPGGLSPVHPVPPGPRHWRGQVARVIEEMFPATSPENWDGLLDLRTAILAGHDWNQALDLFLACKAEMEADNYLPFYRLRRLLSASLRLEGKGWDPTGALSLPAILRTSHRSLADVRRSVARMKSGRGKLPTQADDRTTLQIQEA